MSAQYRCLTVFDFRTRFQLFDSQWPGNIRSPLGNLTLTRLLELASEPDPERVAVVDAGLDPRRAWTYAELIDDVRRTATVLSNAFAPGDRIAVCVHDPVQREILRFAASTAGLPILMLGVRPARDDATFIGGLAVCAGLITDGQADIDPAETAKVRVHLHLADISQEASTTSITDLAPAAPTASGDVAEIRFGPDAAGAVRGIALSHQGLTNAGQLLAERLESEAGDVWVFARGSGNQDGPELALAAMSSGGTCVLVPDDPALVLNAIENEQATILVCEPSLIEALRALDQFAQSDLSTLRTVICGSAAAAPGLAGIVEDHFGANLTRTFGTIETGGILCASGPGDSLEDRSHTVGQPLPHTDVKIVYPGTLKIVPPGTPGEILVRGFATMLAYVHDPDETSRVKDPDGWLRTGELGSLDKWGYLTPTDRRGREPS